MERKMIPFKEYHGCFQIMNLNDTVLVKVTTRNKLWSGHRRTEGMRLKKDRDGWTEMLLWNAVVIFWRAQHQATSVLSIEPSLRIGSERIDLNEKVLVKVTAAGEKIWDGHVGVSLEKDRNGWTEMFLWQLIDVFGEEMNAICKGPDRWPIDPEVRVRIQ